MLFAKLPLQLLLLLFLGLAFGASATAVEKIPVPPESAFPSQLAAQTTEIAELKKLLAQAADDKRKAEDDTRKAEITSLKEQVQAATNNSQKAADWWINATGVVLTIFGLLVTVVGVFAPWWFTRRQKQDLEDQEIQTKEHLKNAKALVASMSALELQGLTHVNKLDELVKTVDTDPSKVSPGPAEAWIVQNALAGISEAEQEKQPIEVRLKLNALEAQTKNKWLDALSFWQQLLDKQPENTDALIGLASVQHAFANQQSSPELQNKYYEFAIENFKRAIPKLQSFELASAQNNLGNALSTLGERDNNPKRLEEAVTTYQEALKERTRERVPLDWAATQNNLGAALRALGERDSNPKRLEAAVTAYQEALKERTRERVPLGWAMTQSNLGNALRTLGERNNNLKRLEEAVTAYQEALKERTRERVPLGWAATQNNLGTALRTLGALETNKEKGIKLLEEAIDTLKRAISEFEKLSDSYHLGVAQRNLKRAEEALAAKRAE